MPGYLGAETRVASEKMIFHPAPLATLRPECGAHFNLYLAIPTPAGQRYLLYKSSDLDITEARRQELIERGVKNLYVSDEEAPDYFHFVDRTLKAILTSESNSPKEKSQVLYNTTSALVQATFSRPDSPMLIKTNRQMIEHTVSVISHEPAVFRTMVSLFALDYSLYTHSVNVATLGTALMLETNSFLPTDIPSIAMGLLMHDIGKSRIPVEILRKSGILSPYELKEMEKHPFFGVQLMQPHEQISPRALDIIYSHHEKLDGRGYPRRLPAARITLETRICSAVDIFDAMTSNRPYKAAMNAYAALRFMMDKMSHELDIELVGMLTKLLGPKK